MTDVKESSQSTDIPLVFRRTPRTLVSMAALELALLCWQHEISNFYPDEMDYSWQLRFTTNHKFISDIFRFPNRIAEIIDWHVEQFRTVFNNFIPYCLPRRKQCSSESKTEVISKVLKNIVFEPCGTIIDVKTVRKLVTGDIIDPKDQFKLACGYSLEADIERLWPLVSNFNTFHHGRSNYWRCRMRNELNEVPTDEQDSPEFENIMSCPYDFCHWTDVEFLWHKLKPREQTSVLTSTDFFDDRITHYLLSKLNRTQLKDVSTRNPCLIMQNLSKNDYTFEYALETWNFMKDFITGAQFFDVLDDLWEKAYYWPRADERVDVLLYEIWLEAPSNLKNYVLVNHVEDFFNNLQDCSTDNYGCDLRFLRCLLSNTSFETRNKLWLKNWREFLRLAIPDDFDKFMRLCFKNEIDIAKFKDNVWPDFKKNAYFFVEMISGGFSRELIEYLRFFSSDENRIRKIKAFIIELVLDKPVFYFDSRAINNFAISFIDSIRLGVDLRPEFFSVEASKVFFSFNTTSPLIFSAEDFKERFIRYNLNAFFRMIDSRYEFNQVREFIDCVLSSNEKCLVEVKRLFYEHCRSLLCSGDLKIRCMRNWDKFSKWCALSQHELRIDLPIDHIFETLLNDVILAIPKRSENLFRYADRIQYCYRCLINFLRWYFQHDAAKMNKLSKLYRYCDVDTLKENNESMISDVVNVFFDDDIEKIEKFYFRVINK